LEFEVLAMTTTAAPTSPDAYLELVRSFPLRPIRSRTAHQQAEAMLRSRAGRKSPAIRDCKTVLALLIAEYERSANLRLDTSKVTAAEIVLHLLHERDMSINALSKLLGLSQSSLSEMLNGRRDWSKSAIVGVSHYFGLQPGLFLR
jgi:antitoxin component HigA of HigAB toxin-antitoxin module